MLESFPPFVCAKPRNNQHSPDCSRKDDIDKDRFMLDPNIIANSTESSLTDEFTERGTDVEKL